jgi:hypothetical protein
MEMFLRKLLFATCKSYGVTAPVTNIDKKMAVFWDVAQCSLIDNDRRFREAYYLYHQGDADDGSCKLL